MNGPRQVTNGVRFSNDTTRSPVSCWDCEYFAVTWDRNFPYSCGSMGFKSRLLPSVEVRGSSQQDCLAFRKKRSS